MQITRQADYAVRAVLYLAGLNNGRRAPTSEIAREQRMTRGGPGARGYAGGASRPERPGGRASRPERPGGRYR